MAEQVTQPSSPPRFSDDDGIDPAVLDALREVYDPCCRDKGISVADMGLLHRATVRDGTARVELVLTTGWCPFATQVLAEVEDAVREIPEVEHADVRVVWDRAWDTDRLSESARARLRFLPDPRAVPDQSAYVAEHWPARDDGDNPDSGGQP